MKQTSKKLFILLTRFPGLDAKLLMTYMRFPYSHASVGLEEDLQTYYSFVVKGFIVEDIVRYCKPGHPPFPCALYELEVPQQVYDRVRDTLQNFVRQKKILRYSFIGLFLSLIHIPTRWKGRYFCSQFVAEVLHKCQAAKLKKSSTLYFPKDLLRLPGMRLVYQGDLLQLSQTPPVRLLV